AVLLFQIIEVVLHRALVSAGDFFLAQRALGVGLGGGRGFFVLDLALAFDADAFQRNARHSAAGRELAFDFGRFQRVGRPALAAVSMSPRVGVRPDDAVVVPTIGELAIPSGRFVLRPSADTAAGLAAGLVPGPAARAPALAGADAHGGPIEVLQRGGDLLRVTQLL